MAQQLEAELDPMAQWAKTGSSESVTALVQGWCGRLQSCAAITLQQGMSIKKAILALGFPEADSKRMLDVLENKVLTSCADAEAPKDEKGQVLNKPYNYLTAAEWGVMEGGNAPARLEILLKRYLKLGMLSLKENTVKAGMALLLAMASKTARAMPSYHDIYDQVKVFKRSFDELKEAHLKGPRSNRGPTVLHYPDNPEDLARELYQAAYPDRSSYVQGRGRRHLAGAHSHAQHKQAAEEQQGAQPSERGKHDGARQVPVVAYANPRQSFQLQRASGSLAEQRNILGQRSTAGGPSASREHAKDYILSIAWACV